jgi:hypothetical protein
MFLFLVSTRTEFFQKKLEILDLVVMTAGFIVNIVLVITDSQGGKSEAAKYV